MGKSQNRAELKLITMCSVTFAQFPQSAPSSSMPQTVTFTVKNLEPRVVELWDDQDAPPGSTCSRRLRSPPSNGPTLRPMPASQHSVFCICISNLYLWNQTNTHFSLPSPNNPFSFCILYRSHNRTYNTQMKGVQDCRWLFII